MRRELSQPRKDRRDAIDRSDLLRPKPLGSRMQRRDFISATRPCPLRRGGARRSTAPRWAFRFVPDGDGGVTAVSRPRQDAALYPVPVPRRPGQRGGLAAATANAASTRPGVLPGNGAGGSACSTCTASPTCARRTRPSGRGGGRPAIAELACLPAPRDVSGRTPSFTYCCNSAFTLSLSRIRAGPCEATR